jgi:hypothetical protein
MPSCLAYIRRHYLPPPPPPRAHPKSHFLIPSLTSSPEYTLDKCKILAEKVSSVDELPYQCKKYPEAVKSVGIKRHDTDNAYAGMKGRLAAQANKEKGIESHAQIQRRLTNSRRFTKQA